MFNLGGLEIIIIAVIIVLLFGGQRLSDFARGLSNTSKEIKKAKKEFENAVDETKENANKAIDINQPLSEKSKE